MAQITASGERAADHYNNVKYWTINWRKQGGSQRMIELSKQEHFYQQEYCGCVYSLRDTNPSPSSVWSAAYQTPDSVLRRR